MPAGACQVTTGACFSTLIRTDAAVCVYASPSVGVKSTVKVWRSPTGRMVPVSGV
jgi:hypothetical protein